MAPGRPWQNSAAYMSHTKAYEICDPILMNSTVPAANYCREVSDIKIRMPEPTTHIRIVIGARRDRQTILIFNRQLASAIIKAVVGLA
jgi:hypothetical protein